MLFSTVLIPMLDFLANVQGESTLRQVVVVCVCVCVCVCERERESVCVSVRVCLRASKRER